MSLLRNRGLRSFPWGHCEAQTPIDAVGQVFAAQVAAGQIDVDDALKDTEKLDDLQQARAAGKNSKVAQNPAVWSER